VWCEIFDDESETFFCRLKQSCVVQENTVLPSRVIKCEVIVRHEVVANPANTITLLLLVSFGPRRCGHRSTNRIFARGMGVYLRNDHEVNKINAKKERKTKHKNYNK